MARYCPGCGLKFVKGESIVTSKESGFDVTVHVLCYGKLSFETRAKKMELLREWRKQQEEMI